METVLIVSGAQITSRYCYICNLREAKHDY